MERGCDRDSTDNAQKIAEKGQRKNFIFAGNMPLSSATSSFGVGNL
jgi:hypothetical protein